MWFLMTRGLKWFGIAFALAQLLAPSRSRELTGVGRQTRVRRDVGARGLLSALARVAMRKRTGSTLSRAAGGAADVALIAAALGSRGRRLAALGALAALAAMSRGARRA